MPTLLDPTAAPPQKKTKQKPILCPKKTQNIREGPRAEVDGGWDYIY